MRLPKVDNAIDTCARHLQASNAHGTEIESFLTQFLLVFICASFEEHIESLVHARVSRVPDSAVVDFVRSATSQLFRSLKTSEIGNLLGRFGSESKRHFQAHMEQRQQAETFFNNLITNRHEVAHDAGCKATFADVVKFYEEGHVVLDAIVAVLKSSEPRVTSPFDDEE